MKALRFDVSKLGEVRRDQNGYLEADAALTRVGVFTYRHPDGTTTRELRHPDEVFKDDSLSSLKYRPMTFLHPAIGKLNAKNTKQYAVGAVIGDVTHDGKLVNGKVQITDEKVIESVLDDDEPVREISAGYRADIIAEKGNWNGEKYDHVQRNIVYNHIALVPKGRAGKDVGLKLDSAEDAYQAPVLDAEDEGKMITVKISDQDYSADSTRAYDVPGAEGVRCEYASHNDEKSIKRYLFDKSKGWDVDKATEWAENHRNDAVDDSQIRSDANMIRIQFAAIRTKSFKTDAFEVKLDEKQESAEAALNEIRIRLDAAVAHIEKLEAKGDEMQGKLDAASDTGKVKASQLTILVRERHDACEAARALGLKNYDAMETDDIKKLVVRGAFPNLKIDTASADYIEGRYGAAIEQIKTDSKKFEDLNNLGDALRNPEHYGLGRQDDASGPRAKFLQQSADMWKDPAERKSA